MKKSIYIKEIQIKAVIVLIILLCISSTSVFSEDKVILTSHNLYPYGSYPKGEEIKMIADKRFRGVAVDVVTCVFDKMGIPLEIEVVPWNRAQFLVQYGKADGFFAASQKDSRDEFAVMSAIIADQEWKWYLLKENPKNPNDSSFKIDATVGGFLGANMLKWMQEKGYNVIATPRDTEGLFRILLAKRVDAVLANNYVMEALIQEHGANDKVKAYLNMSKPLGVYFSKKFLKSHPRFLVKFNTYVAECRYKQE